MEVGLAGFHHFLRLGMVRLIVERAAPRVVIVARGPIVVDHVLLGVAEQVIAVLSLLKGSCFCHYEFIFSCYLWLSLDRSERLLFFLFCQLIYFLTQFRL